MRHASLAFLLWALALACAAEPARPARVLFVGNSLTTWTDVPGRLAELARKMGKNVEARSAAFPNFSLEDHWKDGRALAEIGKGGWDYVVLQQGTSAQADSRASLIDYAKRFATPIRAAGARPAIWMSWPLSDRARDFPASILSHRAAAEAIDAILVPAGEAWLRAISKDKRFRLYSDAIHPTSLGGDLTVLTLWFSLFPAGPQEFDDAYVARIADALEIPEERRELLIDSATRAIDEPLALK